MEPDRMEGVQRKLFSTQSGEVFECACFGRLVMTFKGYWMAFDREGFLRFRHEIAALAHCPRGRESIRSKGLRFNGNSGGAVLILNLTETEELAWLMEAAQAALTASAENPFHLSSH